MRSNDGLQCYPSQVLRDDHLREMHDRELALHTYRQHMTFQDELALDEMESDVHNGGLQDALSSFIIEISCQRASE